MELVYLLSAFLVSHT
jgi:hypothetical protein